MLQTLWLSPNKDSCLLLEYLADQIKIEGNANLRPFLTGTFGCRKIGCNLSKLCKCLKQKQVGVSVTRCWNKNSLMFPKFAQKEPQQYLLERKVFQNGPKTQQIFQILLSENLSPRTFKKRIIWSHSKKRQKRKMLFSNLVTLVEVAKEEGKNAFLQFTLSNGMDWSRNFCFLAT